MTPIFTWMVLENIQNWRLWYINNFSFMSSTIAKFPKSYSLGCSIWQLHYLPFFARNDYYLALRSGIGTICRHTSSVRGSSREFVFHARWKPTTRYYSGFFNSLKDSHWFDLFRIYWNRSRMIKTVWWPLHRFTALWGRMNVSDGR